MIPHRFARLLGATLLLAPSLAFGQAALQQPCTSAANGCTVQPVPSALNTLYGNDLFLQNLIAGRFSTLGAAALLNVGTSVGTVADGGALTAETARAKAAEQTNATAIQTNATAILNETSRAQGVELLKAPIASPAFTGVPSAPTAAAGTGGTQLATLDFVATAVAAGGGGGGGGSGGVPTSRTITGAGLATGGGDLTANRVITVPAAAQSDVATGTDQTKALTSFSVAAALGAKAPLASPAFVGTPTAPTAPAASNSTQLATAAYADRAAANAQLPSFRNRLRNGNFAINQRGVSGTVTLAAGAYGHDGWKAGSVNATYTFSASGPDTTVSISSGTLLQVVDGAKLEGGAYTFSWSGTATCRSYQGTATGSYAASPIAITGYTAGTNATVECSTGTLTRAQFEPGTVTTAYERRDPAVERVICLNYYRILNVGNRFWAGDQNNYSFNYSWDGMRQTPQVSLVVSSQSGNTSGFPSFNAQTSSSGSFVFNPAGIGNIYGYATAALSAEQ